MRALVVLDVETNGPEPAYHSILSIGIAVVPDPAGVDAGAAAAAGGPTILESKQINIRPYTEHADADNAKFWADHPEAKASTEIDVKEAPAAAAELAADFSRWLRDYGSVRFATGLAAVDWTFLRNFYATFAGHAAPRLPFHCTCIDSYFRAYKDARAARGLATSREFLRARAGAIKHVAADDARTEATQYVRMLCLIGRD